MRLTPAGVSSGAVANLRRHAWEPNDQKMRFFQPHDYIAIDYATKRASISGLAPPTAEGLWPGVHVRNLDVVDVEPLRTEIAEFFAAAQDGLPSPVSGLEGRNALSLALRVLERIHEHGSRTKLGALRPTETKIS